MLHNSRLLRVWLAVTIISLFFAEVGSGQQREPLRMTVGYSPISASMLPLWAAVEGRIFQKYGFDIKPVYFGGSSIINAAMAAGEFQIGLGGGASSALQRLSGGDLVLIGAVVRSFTIDGWAKPEIKLVGGLRGKRIAVTRIGTTTHFAGLAMLASAGLERDAAVFTQTGGQGEALASLLSGGVDVAMLAYPHNLIAKKNGFHKLSDLAKTEYGLFPSAGISVRESWLKDIRNRGIAVRFLQGFNDGMTLVKGDSLISTKLLRKYTRIEDEAILHATYDWIKGYFPRTLKVEENSIINMLQFLDHPKAKTADPRQFFDNSLVEEVSK